MGPSQRYEPITRRDDPGENVNLAGQPEYARAVERLERGVIIASLEDLARDEEFLVRREAAQALATLGRERPAIGRIDVTSPGTERRASPITCQRRVSVPAPSGATEAVVREEAR